MANDPLSLVRSGVLAFMDTGDSFFDSGAKMANSILGTFGLPPFLPEKKKPTGQLTPDTPLTFSLPTPQEIMSPVGEALGQIGAVSAQDESLEKF